MMLPARTHLVVVLIACGLGIWGTYRKNEVLTRVSRARRRLRDVLLGTRTET